MDMRDKALVYADGTVPEADLPVPSILRRAWVKGEDRLILMFSGGGVGRMSYCLLSSKVLSLMGTLLG